MKKVKSTVNRNNLDITVSKVQHMVRPPPSIGALTVSYNTMVVGGQFAATVICGLFAGVEEGWRYMLGMKTYVCLNYCVHVIWFRGREIFKKSEIQIILLFIQLINRLGQIFRMEKNRLW